MPLTVDKIKQIFHDLGHSWYFRVWSLLWIVSVIIVFSALVILSEKSASDQQQQDIAMWITNASSIKFPRFHFRLDHRGDEIFNDYACTFGSQSLSPAACQGFPGTQPPPMNQCIAWNSDSFTAMNDLSIMDADSRIYCEITTTGTGQLGNEMMSFGLEGQNVFGGAGLISSTFFAPCDATWLMLQKNTLQQAHGGETIELWGTDLLYHSTLNQTNLYNVTVIMGSYYVNNFQPRNSYNGWMTVGDIGGVSYFMLIIHTLVMIIVGLFLSNSSTFLTGSEH